MRRILLFSALAMMLSGCMQDNDVKEARALADRVVDGARGRVEFRKLPPADTGAPADAYRIETVGNKVIISGNDANSMAVGLNHYLREYCHIAIGWMDTEKPVLPKVLPQVEPAVEVKARVRDRFFLNYCTYGYTMPWWQWKDWEHFIDWMALNGVNLPLAITGQEAVWYDVWTEMGLTDEQVRSYFSGPSHLPWHRMINIDRWGGPLPQSWLRGQAKLQKKILRRERALNMRPVLPAFAGHVPAELKEIYPDADISQIKPWAGFSPEYTPSVLDPMDSLFPVIQRKFIEKQTALYGTDHIYGIDLFNEIHPKSWDPEFLAKAGSGTYASLAAADPEAVWLQMTWLFWFQRGDWTQERIKAYITSYPADKSLLLDYFCENVEIWKQTESYYGVPHIWCYLGNFGGNTTLTGNMAKVGTLIEEALAADPHLKGIGCTLEALDCNPYVFEYVLSNAWDNPSHQDLTRWTDILSDSRAGAPDENARKAWHILVDSVYAKTVPAGFSCAIHTRPRVDINTYWLRPRYTPEALEKALGLLEAAGGDGEAFRFDLANLRRQVISNHSAILYDRWRAAYEAGDRAVMDSAATAFLATADSLKEAVAGEPYFSLEKWIEDARNWGTTPEEKDYFERDARNILTTWGDRGSGLTDYACRSYDGLIETYYKPRWEMFFEAVNAALDKGEPFDAEAFRQRMFDFENAFSFEHFSSYLCPNTTKN